MKSSKKLFVTLLIFGLLMQVATAKETVTVIGSNTVFPIIEATSAAWQEQKTAEGVDVEIAADGPGSGAGIKALINGQTDLAPMSRAPKDSEKQEAADKGMDLNITTVGIDALIVVVNKANPITGLTSQNITDIYNGTITNWSTFGWAEGGDIKVIERDENSGTHDYFNDQFLDGKELDPAKVKDHAQFASTKQLFDTVATESNAIGYGGLAFYDEELNIHIVTVDGVEATAENAKDGSYPVARPLFIVFDNNAVPELALDYVDFVLSPLGQFIVQDVGYVPIGEVGDGISQQEGTPFGIYATISSFMLVVLVRKKL